MNQFSLLKTIFFLGVFCAVAAMAAALTFAAPGDFFKTRVNFDYTNGADPQSPLVKAINGKLYGTTVEGGTDDGGTVFKFGSGTLTTLYSFCSQPNCTDGAYPNGLIQASDGNFYGTTREGGAKDSEGTVFKISPAGTLTTLYSFCPQWPNCPHGDEPNGLIQASDGNFYGTTREGGANGGGTVFQLSPSRTLTTLYSFCSQGLPCTDGDLPYAGLIQATDGNFYGTTRYGGANSYDGGTVFKLSPSGTLTTLYSFCSQSGCADGEYPVGGLIQATDGNFYGTTSYGGANDGGTVFQLSPAGTLTTLYSFCSEPNCTDGWDPNGPIQASDGNFYGTTYGGGANSLYGGTVFQLSPAGTLTTLHSFHGNPGGSLLVAGLIQAPGGNFWGTTSQGGSHGSRFGTVFVLGVGLAPFVETLPTSGTVGTPIFILGFEMTGATSVTFNGTPATFQVISGHTIKTTVPSGATTGPVTVTTPSRTLTSNVNFQVN
jgi:uncharacterized repeat protein (TIGR03803 family)